MRCGKLLCTYDKGIIINIPNATVLYSNIDGHICVGLEYAYDDKDSGNMWVKDGTVCGLNKVYSLLLPTNFLISNFKCIFGIFLII